MLKEYEILIEAAKIATECKLKISDDDGSTYISPAYKKMHRVVKMLTAEAAEVMEKGEKL